MTGRSTKWSWEVLFAIASSMDDVHFSRRMSSQYFSNREDPMGFTSASLIGQRAFPRDANSQTYVEHPVGVDRRSEQFSLSEKWNSLAIQHRSYS